MAHFVAKELHQRPNDILDGWGTPELLVAYGQYANEHTKRNYEEWRHADPKVKAKMSMPDEYAAYFHGE